MYLLQNVILFVNSDVISHYELKQYITEALFCICLFDGPWDELYDENEIYKQANVSRNLIIVLRWSLYFRGDAAEISLVYSD